MSHPLCLKHEQRGVSLTDHSTWCYGCEIDGLRSDLAQARQERDEYKADSEDWQEAARRVAEEPCGGNQKHCTCVVLLRKNAQALTAQVATLREALTKIQAIAGTPSYRRILELADRALHPAEGRDG